MVIYCNGGYRTGSTVVFNIARLLHETAGIEYEKLNFKASTHLLRSNKDRHNHIIKVHEWTPESILNHVRVIHSYRNPFDTIASWFFMHNMRNSPLSKYDTKEEMVSALVWGQKKQINDLVKNRDNNFSLLVSYDKITKLYPAIDLVSKHTGISCDSDASEYIATSLDVNYVKFKTDNIQGAVLENTEFRKNHVSNETRGKSGGFFLLGEDLQKIVIDEFGEYEDWNVHKEVIREIKPFHYIL